MKNFVPCQSVRNELNQLPDSRYTYIKTKHDTYYTHTPTYIHTPPDTRACAHTHTRCSTRDTQVHSYRHREVKSKWVEDEEKKGRGGK